MKQKKVFLRETSRDFAVKYTLSNSPYKELRLKHFLSRLGTTTIKEDEHGVQNLSVDDKEECRECQWKYWCGGGCPLESYLRTGRYDLKSPNCRIYKALYPEVLRLEGLRLLQEHHNA